MRTNTSLEQFTRRHKELTSFVKTNGQTPIEIGKIVGYFTKSQFPAKKYATAVQSTIWEIADSLFKAGDILTRQGYDISRKTIKGFTKLQDAYDNTYKEVPEDYLSDMRIKS
jgi:hypothetical protein